MRQAIVARAYGVLDPASPISRTLTLPCWSREVGWLQVAMDDAKAVSVVEAASGLNRKSTAVHGQWSMLFDEQHQILARNILHHQEVDTVGLVGIVGRDDVGVR